MLKRSFVIFLLGILFLIEGGKLGTTWAEETMKNQDMVEREQWANLASQVAKRVKEGNLSEARNQLAILSNRFSKANFQKESLEIEALHALASVLLEMERALNQVKPNEIILLRAAERLEMAFDALTHPHQPMWKQYDHTLSQHLNIAQEAVQLKNKEAVQEAIRQFYDDYQLIRPALIVSKRPATVNRLDSIITWIRSTEEWPKLKQGLTQLQRMIHPLFHGTDQEVILMGDGVDQELIWWTSLWVTLFIVSGLGYVSWRKFQAMKKGIA